MFRAAVLIIGLLWASLLLLTWSAPAELSHTTAQIETSTPRQ